jgi:hypothetical protein
MHLSMRLLPSVTAIALSLTAIAPAAAQNIYEGMTCPGLWLARNEIYANRGFCFESPRAIREFGPRCYPPYGRLTPTEQRWVDDIRAVERRRGCPRG